MSTLKLVCAYTVISLILDYSNEQSILMSEKTNTNKPMGKLDRRMRWKGEDSVYFYKKLLFDNS